MKVHGECHCGAITYEAEIDPGLAVICHCTDCQIFSGSPFRATVPAPAESFNLNGAPRLYVKVAESGRKRAQAFCSTCGSSIYSADAEAPTRYNIRLGSLRERAEIAAQAQIWRSSAQEWALNVSALPARSHADFVEPPRRT